MKELTKNYVFRKKAFLASFLFVIAFVLLTLAQDFIQTIFQNSSFYFSESFLFSLFWWLFVPFYYAQYLASKFKNATKISFRLILIITPIVLHLIAFPILIWIISGLFFDHTFTIGGTLVYTLTAHFYKLIVFYSVPILVYQYFNNRLLTKEKDKLSNSKTHLTSLLITDGNKNLSIAISDVLYFEANTPYINIHLAEKTYLLTETLKTLATKVDENEFVRIHKSTIVNLNKVQSYVSRLNGDYDLILINETKLRISRNYATDFKSKFQESHRLSAK